MSFPTLTQFASRRAAAWFGRDVSAVRWTCWFPATATTAPTARAGYSVTVTEVTRGEFRARGRELEGFLSESEERYTVQIPAGTGGLAYEPVKARTTFLLGTVKASAKVLRVLEWSTAGGIYEIQCEVVTGLIPD